MKSIVLIAFLLISTVAQAGQKVVFYDAIRQGHKVNITKEFDVRGKQSLFLHCEVTQVPLETILIVEQKTAQFPWREYFVKYDIPNPYFNVNLFGGPEYLRFIIIGADDDSTFDCVLN